MLEKNRQMKKRILIGAMAMVLSFCGISANAFAQTNTKYSGTYSGQIKTFGWKYTFSGNYGTYLASGSTNAGINTSKNANYTMVQISVNNAIVSTVKATKKTVSTSYNTGTRKYVRIYHNAYSDGISSGGYTVY